MFSFRSLRRSRRPAGARPASPALSSARRPAGSAGLLLLQAAGFCLLGTLAVLGARAQTTHQHVWDVDPALSGGAYAEKTDPYTHEAIAISLYMEGDTDTCTTAPDYSGDDYMTGSYCSFYNQRATNNVRVVEWTASRTGGKWGRLDGTGQFVEAATPVDWSQVSHYKAPGTTGSVTLTVRFDDDPRAEDPATGTLITTANDPVASATLALTVTTNPYAATWSPDTPLSGAGIAAPVSGGTVPANTAVTCTAASAADQDKKESPSGYPGYPDGSAGDGVTYEADTVTYRWSATGGSFVNAQAASTTWSCGNPGTYTLTLTVDDLNDANLPSGDNGTRNDPSVAQSVTVTVQGDEPTWSPDTPISGGVQSPAGDLNLAPGGTYTFTAAPASDRDRRSAPDGVTYADDGVSYRWTCSGGALSGDINGTSVTWTAPATVGDYTVTLTVDDQGTVPSGEGGSRDDSPLVVTRTVHVFHATWAPAAGISGGGIGAPGSGLQVTKGQLVTCTALAATDTDQRTAVDGGVTYPADTCTYRWSCPQGSFSNGGSGPEVVWTAPTHTGGTFTLTLTVDDAAALPAGEGGDRNDPARTFTTQVTVKAPTWDPDTGIDAAGLTAPAAGLVVDPSTSVACAAAPATDTDRRTDEQGGVTTAADTCTYAWQATGGSFSPSSGQYVNWNAPSVSGLYTLTLRVNDQATLPSGEIGTRDDPERTFTVQVRVRHLHQWAAVHDLQSASFTVNERFPVHGERVELTPSGSGSDEDQCLAANCPFPGGRAPNVTRKHRWTAGAGQFGYLANGSWVPSADPALITHWEAPGTSGPVTLTLETEDTPEATDPETNSTVTTYDDPVGRHAVEVRVVTHHHPWEVGDPLTASAPTVSERYPLRGEYVAVGIGTSEDRDYCPLANCVFPGGFAANAVRVVAWSATDAYGQPVGRFGYFAGGTWTPSYDASRITHWEAPPQKAPDPDDPMPYYDDYGPVAVTLRAEVDDVPTAYDAERGEDVTTYDDPAVYGETQLTVVRHKHTWEAVDNVPAEVTVDNETPTAGEVLSVGGGYLGSGGMDMDVCEEPGCTLEGACAYNDTHVVRWEAKAGETEVGTFGRLDGMGQFIEWQAGEDPVNITHWRAPATGIPADGLSVTLKVVRDDGPPLPPTVWDPELELDVRSYDDAECEGEKTVTVLGHQHEWMPMDDIPAPSLTVETQSPRPRQIIAVSAPMGGTDQDSCMNQSACPFPSNTAPNGVELSEWSDGEAGGAFGKYVDGQFEICPASEVTHYRCPPQCGEVRLSVKVEDKWQQIAEPGSETLVDTHNDFGSVAETTLLIAGRELILKVAAENPAFMPIPMSREEWEPQDGSKTCGIQLRLVARDENGNEAPLLDEEFNALQGRTVRALLTASQFPGEDSVEDAGPASAGYYDYSLSSSQPDVLYQDLVLGAHDGPTGRELWATSGAQLGAVLYAHDYRAQAHVIATVDAPSDFPVRVEYDRPADFSAPDGLWVPVPLPDTSLSSVTDEYLYRAYVELEEQGATPSESELSTLAAAGGTGSKPLPTDDKEPKDPDGSGPMYAHATVGDGYTVRDEQGGMRVAGSFFDPPAKRRTARLSISKKELLLTASIMHKEGDTNTPIYPWAVDGAISAMNKARDCFGSVGITVHVVWNYAKIPGKTPGNWFPYSRVNPEATGQTAVQINLHRQRGYRQVVFAGRPERNLAQEWPELGVTISWKKKFSNVISGCILFLEQINQHVIARKYTDPIRALDAAVAHELGHVAWCDHLVETHPSIYMNVTGPGVLYGSNALMWGSYRDRDEFRNLLARATRTIVPVTLSATVNPPRLMYQHEQNQLSLVPWGKVK